MRGVRPLKSRTGIGDGGRGAPTTTASCALRASIFLVFARADEVIDPIALGYVRSLAKPGGNITGVVFQQPELAVKRMQIMKEVLPGLTSAIVVWDAASADQRKEVHRAAAELGLHLTDAEFRDQPYEYEASFAAAGDGGALLVCVSPIFFRERQVLAAAALRRRAATMFGLREFVEGGGLVSTARAFRPCTGALPIMLSVSPTGPSLPICRSSNQPSLSWLSTSRLRALSA